MRSFITCGKSTIRSFITCGKSTMRSFITCGKSTIRSLITYLILVSAVPALGQHECVREDWGSSSKWTGLFLCSADRLINGFVRNYGEQNGIITLLEYAECCAMTTPWDGYAKQTMNANWGAANNNWDNCPAGYFLEGMYRSSNRPGSLYNIEEGRCTKPRNHPNYHSQCYNQNISQCFQSSNLCRCNDGYFITGLHRGSCGTLFCLETLRCCKMAQSLETLNDVSKVKTRIMDTTMSHMALLAHYLGYGWCAGCRALYVGEDFYRSGYSWIADKSKRCDGYMSDQRLSMAYGDWSYRVKDIRFGKPVIEELLPETLDSGNLYNNDTTEASKTISRSETSVRTVSHTTISSWRSAHEARLQIAYKFLGFSYSFSYENSETKEDFTGKEHSKTLEISTSKTLAANSSASWKFVSFKTRTTIPYTATVLVGFSTELRGFLRWGGGYNGDSTNYHVRHRGSEGRPTFNYRFGNADTAFYRDLKEESDTNSLPWMWNDMKTKRSDAQYLIDDLCDENNYVFTLNGQFEDVEGKRVDIHWDTAKLINKRSADHEEHENEVYGLVNFKHLARAGPDDLPAPRPNPPDVKIEVKKRPVSLPSALHGD